jgi:hypothetical protein
MNLFHSHVQVYGHNALSAVDAGSKFVVILPVQYNGIRHRLEFLLVLPHNRALTMI